MISTRICCPGATRRDVARKVPLFQLERQVSWIVAWSAQNRQVASTHWLVCNLVAFFVNTSLMWISNPLGGCNTSQQSVDLPVFNLSASLCMSHTHPPLSYTVLIALFSCLPFSISSTWLRPLFLSFCCTVKLKWLLFCSCCRSPKLSSVVSEEVNAKRLLCVLMWRGNVFFALWTLALLNVSFFTKIQYTKWDVFLPPAPPQKKNKLLHVFVLYTINNQKWTKNNCSIYQPSDTRHSSLLHLVHLYSGITFHKAASQWKVNYRHGILLL